MKAVTTPVRIDVKVKEELENFLNPTGNKFIAPKIGEYITQAVLEKMEKERRTAGLKKSA